MAAGLRIISLGVFILQAAALNAAQLEKISEHFYVLASPSDGANTGLLATDDGWLMIDPPAEAELDAAMAAARRVSPRPVRWAVFTNYERFRRGNTEALSKLGAVLVVSARLRQLAQCAPAVAAVSLTPQGAPPPEETPPAALFVFETEMRLHSGALEARIISLRHAAHTSGDVVVLIPSEKVMHVGMVFAPGSYPEIDRSAGEGSAVDWSDAVKQAIAEAPLLRQAIPAKEKAPPSKEPQEEKTLEQAFAVVPGYGPRSDLQELKTLLDRTQKLRTEIARLVRASHTRDELLTLPALGAFRILNNFDAYALDLYDELSVKRR